MCTCVYVYFHCVIKCSELWRMKCLPYKLQNLLSGDYSQHFLKQPLFSSSLDCPKSCYIYFVVYLELYTGIVFAIVSILFGCSVYHSLWLDVLEFLSSLFFFLPRSEHLDTITKSLLSIIDINLTNFLRHASWNPLASYSNLNIFQATKLPC